MLFTFCTDVRRVVAGFIKSQHVGFSLELISKSLIQSMHSCSTSNVSIQFGCIYIYSIFFLGVWVVQGFKNFRGCPRAAHQFKVFQNVEDWYAVIATNAVENNTEIYSFNTVLISFKNDTFLCKI